MRMPFELFVALRYLFSRRKQTFIYIISIMSILGVALGVGALVVVLGVYNGLTTDMRDKIIGANAHGIVMSYVPAAFQQHPDLVRRVEAVEHVRGATPFIYTEVMLSAAGGVKGLVLRGIDPESAPKVLSMLREIRRGSVTDLKREGTPGIVIGEELAKRLGIGLGSRVNLLSPSGEKGATGYSPRIRPFEVVGIFKTGMFEYDATLAFVDLKAARDILGLPDGFLTGIEIMVDDVYKADVIAQSVQDTLGSPFYVRHWMEMNANLFAALKLEKIGMFILLTMVVLIGSFSIVTSLVMLVMEKTRDIAILMSMGATRSMIRRIFMLQGPFLFLLGAQVVYQARQDQAALPGQAVQAAARPPLQRDRHRHSHGLDVVIFLRYIDILLPGKALDGVGEERFVLPMFALPQHQDLRPVGRLHQTVHKNTYLLRMGIPAPARRRSIVRYSARAASTRRRTSCPISSMLRIPSPQVQGTVCQPR